MCQTVSSHAISLKCRRFGFFFTIFAMAHGFIVLGFVPEIFYKIFFSAFCAYFPCCKFIFVIYIPYMAASFYSLPLHLPLLLLYLVVFSSFFPFSQENHLNGNSVGFTEVSLWLSTRYFKPRKAVRVSIDIHF